MTNQNATSYDGIDPEGDTAYAVFLAARDSSQLRKHLTESLNSAAEERAAASAALDKAEASYLLCAQQLQDYELEGEVLHY